MQCRHHQRASVYGIPSSLQTNNKLLGFIFNLFHRMSFPRQFSEYFRERKYIVQLQSGNVQPARTCRLQNFPVITEQREQWSSTLFTEKFK
jgi:hypothetical protein